MKQLFFLFMIAFAACESANSTRANEDIALDSTAADSPSMTDTSGNWLENKLREGVDFLVSGNEPFWSVEIDFDGQVKFTNADGLSISTPAVQGPHHGDSTMHFQAETDSGSLSVLVTSKPCTDGMSGRKFAYSAEVKVQPKGAGQATSYSGCGRYLVEDRLNGTWKLQSINGQPIDTTGAPKGAPMLDFNLVENRVSGHTGCNSISGSLEVGKDTLQIGQIISTRMACANMDFEARYLESLDKKIIPFEIRGETLVLKTDIGELQFKMDKSPLTI